MHRLAAELLEEEMTPGRWHGASLGMPKRSTSRDELKQAIAEIHRKKSDGDITEAGRAAATPSQQVPYQIPGHRLSGAPPYRSALHPSAMHPLCMPCRRLPAPAACCTWPCYPDNAIQGLKGSLSYAGC